MKKKQKILPKINKLLKVSLASVLAFSLAYTSGVISIKASEHVIETDIEYTKVNGICDELGNREGGGYVYSYVLKDSKNLPQGLTPSTSQGAGVYYPNVYKTCYLGTVTQSGIYKAELTYDFETYQESPRKLLTTEKIKRTVTFKILPYLSDFTINGVDQLENGQSSKFTIDTTQEGTGDLFGITTKWEVSNQKSADTKITEDGTLTIGADETQETVTIQATVSNYGVEVMSKKKVVSTGNTFIAVTGLDDVTPYVYAERGIKLNATVLPSDAYKTDIEWELASGYESYGRIENGILIPDSSVNPGQSIKVNAIIRGGGKNQEDFKKSYNIEILPNYTDPYVGIEDISIDATTMEAGSKLSLKDITPTFTPSNASNQNISWYVEDPNDIGATYVDKDQAVKCENPGTFNLCAKIFGGSDPEQYYVKKFSINVKAPFVPVSGITNGTTKVYLDSEMELTATVEPSNVTNKNIVWSILDDGGTGATIINGNILKAGSTTGTIKVEAKVENGSSESGDAYTKTFEIPIEKFVPVEDIDFPDSIKLGYRGEPYLYSSAVVTPRDASGNSMDDVIWSIKDDGGTGSTIEKNGIYFEGKDPGKIVLVATIPHGLAPNEPFIKEFNVEVTSKDFVPITEITNIPTTGYIGYDVCLNGKVNPIGAPTKIWWKVIDDGGTEATISDRIYLTAKNEGTVKLKAEVYGGGAESYLDYAQEFDITFKNDYKKVTGITSVPTAGTAGVDLPLSGSIEPSDASNTQIKWSVKDAGTTGATINGNVLKTTAGGTVKVVATIAGGETPNSKYTKEFDITIASAPLPHKAVSNITLSSVSGSAKEDITLSGTVEPSDANPANIVWTVKDAGTTGATIEGNTLKTTAAGTVTITATVVGGGATTSENYTKDFVVTINPVHQKVTGITDLPTSGVADHNLELTGTVTPSDASKKDITWSIVDAGTTGAVLSGKTLKTNAAGTVKLKATIAGGGATSSEDYSEEVIITIAANPNPYKAVTDITGVSTSGTATIDMTLSGTIAPTDATNQNITWSVKDAGTTGATIDGNTLKTTAKGTVVVTATVEGGGTTSTQDYTKDFTITIKENHKSVTGITGISTSGTAKQTILLNATITPSDASKTNIVWTIKNAGTTGASIVNGNQLKTTGAGTVVVTATIPGGGETSDDDYTKDFTITIAPAPTYTLTKDVTELTGAKVTLSETTGIESDGSVTVDVSPDTGKKFNTAPDVSVTGAQIDQVITMPNGDYRYILKNFTANATVKVVGEAKSEDPLEEYQITVQTNGNGTASANVNKSEAGKVITLFKEAKPGYRFVKWEVVNGTITIKNDKFTMPKGNVSIKAVFEKIPGPDDPETPTDDSDKSNDGNQDGSGSDSTSKDKDSAIKDTGASSSNTTTSMMVLIAFAGLCVLEKKRRVSDK